MRRHETVFVPLNQNKLVIWLCLVIKYILYNNNLLTYKLNVIKFNNKFINL